MAVLPFLCRDLSFLPKLSYHRNVSLAVFSPILFFSFCQKKICICINGPGSRRICLLFCCKFNHINTEHPKCSVFSWIRYLVVQCSDCYSSLRQQTDKLFDTIYGVCGFFISFNFATSLTLLVATKKQLFVSKLLLLMQIKNFKGFIYPPRSFYITYKRGFFPP